IARQLYGNPVAWGMILVALGSLFVARTVLSIQFPVRKMLPVVLVILGAYILFDYLKRRRRREELRIYDVNNPPSSVVSNWSTTSARFGTGEFPTRAGQRQISSSRFQSRPSGR